MRGSLNHSHTYPHKEKMADKLQHDPVPEDFDRMAAEIDSQGFAEISDKDADQGDTPDSPPATEGEPAKETPDGDEPKVKEGDDANEPDTEAEGRAAESEYAKAQKDKARLDRNWEKQQEIAEQNRKDREELERERAELKRERESKPATTQTTRREVSDADEDGYTAEDYDNAYEGFLKEGDDIRATEAKKRSQDLKVKTFQRKWGEDVDRLRKDNPDLDKADSPLRVAAEKVLNEIPIFKMIPTGASLALRVAKADMSTASVSGLQAENQKLKEEIQRLTKATAIGGSGPARQAADKAFDDKSPKEQLSELIAAAEEADRAGAF